MEFEYYDERLTQLQKQVARARQLVPIRKELCHQREALAEQVAQLEAVKLDEQADVARLEGRSLAAFFYNVIGKMDAQLDKERQEAYAARVKYDAAVQELDAAEAELRRCEAELAGLSGCEQQYQTMLEEKSAAIKSQGGANADEILRLEERAAFLNSQETELQEAITAGNAALRTTQRVLNSLDSAEGWGTWDLFGGGLISDLAKHSHLDDAQAEIESLQSQLRSFKTELADVTIQADMQVNVDGFLRFADYFFDGLFADWAVLDQIKQSQEQVYSTQSQIRSLLCHLSELLDSVHQEQDQIQDKRSTFIQKVKF